MRVIKSCILIFVLTFVVTLAAAQNKVVIIKHDHDKWKMIVNGDPFFIKGVVGNESIAKVKEYGGNSVRSGCHEEELDKINDFGLKALVNLPAKAERDGMDYNDTSEIRKQTEKIISIVKITKDHPAVLMWAIGNELDYIPPLKPFNPKVWDAVNQVAKAIHSMILIIL